MRKINLSKPYIADQAIDAVVSVIKSGWLTQGKKVAELEDLIKNSIGTQYALAMNSATSGLHVALLSLGVGAGDEVIVPSFTWVATANVVELCGARPVFVDINAETFNADLEQVASKITDKTKAIIIVHLFGKPFDILKLKSKLKRDISIIEDAACALGASVNGAACGTIGEIGVFSFHPRKSITTGEGGMVVTNKPSLYAYMNMLRNHGQDCTVKNASPSFMFDCPIVGFNFRMTDLQAVLGIPQFLQLNEIISYRKKLVEAYKEKLSDCKFIVLPFEERNESHTWQAYVISIVCQEKRDEIMKGLSIAGIETRPGTHAVHMLSYYKTKYQLSPEDFPNAYNSFNSTISLPLHNHMTKEDVEYISEKLIEVINAL